MKRIHPAIDHEELEGACARVLFEVAQRLAGTEHFLLVNEVGAAHGVEIDLRTAA